MTSPPVGHLLRSWRQRRRLSQLDLSNEAGVSARHLSFVETGRSRPSREMVLHLAESLEVPLRARNELLVAAGFAPLYGRRGLDSPDLAAVRRAIDTVLAAYEPFPAVVVDRGWHLVAGNRGVPLLTDGADPRLPAAHRRRRPAAARAAGQRAAAVAAPRRHGAPHPQPGPVAGARAAPA